MAFDLVIRGGRVVDGSGQPGYDADVGIKGGRIVEIGRIDERAKRVVQADGLVVAPGFIDHHTHFDAQVLWDPLPASSCWHGVTTVITGNCSLSLAPCKPADRDALASCFARVEAISREALDAGVDWNWLSFGDYLKRIEQGRGLNIGALVGHTAIRQYVMGEEATERKATPEELAEMKKVLRTSLEAGAIGLSLNKSKHHYREDGKPIPATAAPLEELLALGQEVGDFGSGMIQANCGSMGSEVTPEDNYKFLRALSTACRRPIVFNSIQHRWQAPHTWSEALELGARCLADGHRIHGATSTLPTTFEFTLRNVQLIFDKMPTWRPLMFASIEERIAAFEDPSLRPKLRYEAAEDPQVLQGFHKRWDFVTVESAVKPENKRWEGRSVMDMATAQGKHPVDAFLDLATSERLETAFKTVMSAGDKEATSHLLKHPATIVGTSDAGAHTAFLADYGYCTEFLGPWIRDRKLMSLEQAVSRLTLMPASIYGLHDRGQIRTGFAADLVVFDPATIAPKKARKVHDYPAGQARMDQMAEGIHATVVNGSVLLENGQHTGHLPGQILRNERASKSLNSRS